MHRAKVDFKNQRAAAAEIPAIRPVGDLMKLPFSIFEPRRPRLRIARRVGFVVADGHTPQIVEANFRVVVDNAALLRNRVNDVGSLQRDGQLERFAAAGFPVDQILAARVAQMMVARRVRRFAPHPRKMKPPVRGVLCSARDGDRVARSSVSGLSSRRSHVFIFRS